EWKALGADRDGGALEDEPAGGSWVGDQLPEEPALRGPPRPAEEQEGGRGVVGSLRRSLERRELRGPTDERRAGEAPGHWPDDTRRPGLPHRAGASPRTRAGR